MPDQKKDPYQWARDIVVPIQQQQNNKYQEPPAGRIEWAENKLLKELERQGVLEQNDLGEKLQVPLNYQEVKWANRMNINVDKVDEAEPLHDDIHVRKINPPPYEAILISKDGTERIMKSYQVPLYKYKLKEGIEFRFVGKNNGGSYVFKEYPG